ncbi:MAG: hypothetical protein KJ053_11400 [Dehalococcoidia bacterium]|nr:hypothetical protein [Dehalococcoidia bacterium]
MRKAFGEDIDTLRETIRANDGANVARGAFARKVNQLISDFYDDIGELTGLRLSDILDLFLIKVLYVDRGSRDAATLDYLGRMLERFLRASELTGTGRNPAAYLSDLMQEASEASSPGRSPFETFRRYGDNALFISGIFRPGLGRRRSAGLLGGGPLADATYYITMGRRYYGMAAGEGVARALELRPTLLRLAQFFDVYADALNEVSGRYVLGMDMRLIADKMLDAFNRYRATREPQHLETARKYASLLRLDASQWPVLEPSPPGEPAYY